MTEQTSPPSRRQTVIQIALIVLIVALGATWVYVLRSHQPPPDTSPPRTVVEKIVEKVQSVGSLDRPTALAILQRHPELVDPVDTTGIFISGNTLTRDALSSYLLADGYIECPHACSLTPKGRAQHWKAVPIPGSGAVKVEIPLANGVAQSISGIRSGVAGLATGTALADVDFTIAPLPMGKSLVAFAATKKFCGPNYGQRWGGKHAGQASMTRYDDGWRVAGFDTGLGAMLGLVPGETPCGIDF